LTETQLKGTNQPTVVLVEQIEGRAAVEIQRTDVATLLDLIRFVLEDDPERQALGSTDVGSVVIDAACPGAVEKRTRTRRMGLPVPQELGMRTANSLGLDLRDG
jgi:hypothetical protein